MGFRDQFLAAHEEVMRATGWDHILENITYMYRSATAGGEWGPSALAAELVSQVRAFVDAVDWTGEPFFRYLAAFHITVAAIVLYNNLLPHRRPSEERLLVLSVVLLALAGLTYPLHYLGMQYGGALFKEKGLNYFEDSGIFIAAVYFLPLAVWCVLVQVRLFAQLFVLMADVKRRQLAARQRAQQRAPQEAQQRKDQ